MIIYSKHCGVVITTTENIESIEVVENDIVAKRRNSAIKIGRYESSEKAQRVLSKIYNALKDGKAEFEMPDPKIKRPKLKTMSDNPTETLLIPNWLKAKK